MNRNIIIIAILILAVIGLVLVFGGGSDSDNDKNQKVTQNVNLEAHASQDSYNSGDPVSLNIKLTNSGESNVCLSEGATGNIKFTSFKKDGEDVETRPALSEFLASFSEILQSNLKSVAPGESMELSLSSELDPGLGKQALSMTTLDDMSGVVTFYNVAEQGSYEAKLVYEYTAGPSDDCKDTLLNKTNEATVTFEVK